MRLVSTTLHGHAVSFTDALLAGIAPDGGLYLPIDWPHLRPAEIEAWHSLAFADLAARLATRLLAGELPVADVERLTRAALDFPVPTVHVEGRQHVLELFHGPTLAFKDFGARFLARFFGYLLASRRGRATILVATSGDTGGAVARGFLGVPGIRVVVLYPAGKVSPFQEAQMATLGGNVEALRVPGTFDDCQRLVKRAFLDPSLARLGLSSANSINIGRLLPQTFYYVASYLAVTRAVGDPVIFVVPSGNLGNLTAGVLAARLGLAARFVAATNANAVLPEYLANGLYRARPAIRTISSAMDVGDPSNFLRLMGLYDGSPDWLAEDICAMRIDEAQTRRTIRDTYRRSGYLLDPHGAVGYAAAEREARLRPADAPIITLATAHPAKFGDVVREELGFAPPLPDRERDWAGRPCLAKDLGDSEYETFRAVLLETA